MINLNLLRFPQDTLHALISNTVVSVEAVGRRDDELRGHEASSTPRDGTF